MTLLTFLGPWLYWPIVVIVVFGTASWSINCITTTYTELRQQVKELRRLAGLENKAADDS